MNIYSSMLELQIATCGRVATMCRPTIFIRHKFQNQIACDLPAISFFRRGLHGSNDLTFAHVIGASANVIAREFNVHLALWRI